MRCPDIEELIEFARQQSSERDAAIVDHIAVCEKCRHELRIINETLAAEDWSLPEGSDDVGSVIHQCHDDVECYIKTATAVTTDRWGRMSIAPGERMIVDPVTGECVMATKDNVDLFKRNGMSLYINPNKEMHSKLDALGMNMEALKGTAIPGYNLPWWVKLVPSPFTVNFRTCREIKVRQSDFIKHLERHGVIPSSSEVRKDVWSDIENANLFRVYELRGWGVTFHVYSIFVTHIAVEKQCGVTKLSIKPAGGKIYEAVMEFVKEWKGRLKTPNCRCFSIGSFGGWDRNLNVVELPDSIQVLSSPHGDDSATWLVKHNSLEHMRPIYRTLVYRLYPESWATWHDRICEVLKSESFECSMTVSRMAEISHIPPDCVAEVFEYLRTKDKRWQSTRNKTTGELALVESNGRTDAGAFVPLQHRWLWCVAFAVMSALVSIMFQCISSGIKHGDLVSAFVGFVFYLVLSMVKNNLERKTKE